MPPDDPAEPIARVCTRCGAHVRALPAIRCANGHDLGDAHAVATLRLGRTGLSLVAEYGPGYTRREPRKP